MGIFEVVVLAIIQGLTEFLPVSSSGHLAAARLLFGFGDAGGSAFDALLHLGTLAAVLVYYRRVWWAIARSVVVDDAESRDKRDLLAKLALATVPAAVAGYILQDNADVWFRSSQVVALGLMITAIVLLGIDLVARRVATIGRAGSAKEVSNEISHGINFLDAVLIGAAQAAALVPGVSRSGVTIVAGRARGLSRRQAATFSFLLSAPIIAGAGLASLASLASGGFSLSQLLLGLIVSFGAGLAAIHGLLKLIERVAFWPLAVYLFALAGVLLYAG